jgi:hypothetical protein
MTQCQKTRQATAAVLPIMLKPCAEYRTGVSMFETLEDPRMRSLADSHPPHADNQLVKKPQRCQGFWLLCSRNNMDNYQTTEPAPCQCIMHSVAGGNLPLCQQLTQPLRQLLQTAALITAELAVHATSAAACAAHTGTVTATAAASAPRVHLHQHPMVYQLLLQPLHLC